MPPKVRRPAARVIARAPRIRRPAAAGAPAPLPAVTKASELPVGIWLDQKPKIFTGQYWGDQAEVAGVVQGIFYKGSEAYVTIEASGTRSEGLLKYLSGRDPRLLTGHVCGDPCGALVWEDSLLHISEVADLGAAPEAWTTNLEAAGGHGAGGNMDELARMRAEADRLLERGERPMEKKEKKRDRGSASSGSKDQGKKTKEGRRKKKKKKGEKLRIKAVKNPEDLFKLTGLDPAAK